MFYIFLDRCAVVAIRDFLNDRPHSQPMIDKLKSLDIEGDIVSSMPALIEGNRTFRSNIDKCRKSTEEEIRKTEQFFKNANLHPNSSNWKDIQKLYNCEHEEEFGIQRTFYA